ncbi:hypothetical protein BKA83DRAFT_4132698 [Pisolithus microcarpus]|nr:hypothetical protein BKA83DRAFT_4132698 [Pisolithus microcarpus]
MPLTRTTTVKVSYHSSVPQHPTTADQGMEMSVVENKEESTKENDKEIALVKAQDSSPATTKSRKGKLSAQSKARISACLVMGIAPTEQFMPDPSMGPSVAEELAAVCSGHVQKGQGMHKSTKSKAQGRQDKVQMEVQGNAEAVPSTSKLIVSKSYKKCGLEPDAEEEVTGEMASNTAGASEMQEPVLVVNKVREMAVVRQENEQEASGPKVKAKARETEASLACHLQSEDDMEEQGAQVQPSRRQSLFPRGDNLIPNIKVTESTEADELGFAVETAIADVTLGYALMTVIHDQAEQRSEEEHWGSGPPMQIPCSSIDCSSLKLLKLGTYENKKSLKEVPKLMDMKATHVQYKKALQEKAKGAKVEEHQQYLLDEDIAGLEKELDKSGSWLAQFVDKDKLASHPQRMWLLDQLTSNSQMIALRDNDKDKLHWDSTSYPQLMKSNKKTPMEVKILGLTVDAAEKEEKDVEKQCQKVAHAMMAEARASTYFAWGLVDELAEKSLVIQADVMKSSKHDHPWHLWGLKDKASRELWNNLLDKFDQHTPAGLSLAIKEVVSWVEPFVTPSSMQRGDCVWRDYMCAMTANMMQCGKSIGIIALYLASVKGQVKVYDASNLHTGLLEKKFLECLQQIINQYHDQVESWSGATPIPTYLCPEPNQTVWFENLTEHRRRWSFPKDHYKGMKQLVKALAPMTLNEASRQLLLATEVGWELHHKVANIMQGCRGAQKPWVWWDGIQDQPYHKNGLDASDEMSCMDIGETWENWANHITMENNGALPQDLWLAAGTMLRCMGHCKKFVAYHWTKN